MKILYADLGWLDSDDVVVVTIEGDSMNVRLLDPSHFESYRHGRAFRSYGVHARTSPIRLAVPHAGRWYVALDCGGHAFSVRWGAAVERAKLPGSPRP